ncbi:hypothetical protein LLG07_04100 [bacterium]|nr:hypothetical protein [bacterium]
MAGAFRAEIVLEQALSDPGGVHNVFYILGDSVLEVNKYGLRTFAPTIPGSQWPPKGSKFFKNDLFWIDFIKII